MTSRPTTEPATLPVTDLLHVEPWGLRSAANGLPAVPEEIDVSNFSGNAVIDITTIDGIRLNNFTHIQVKFQSITRTTTGSQIQMRLRREGGAFNDEVYRWQTTSETAANPSNTTFPLTENTGLSTYEGVLWLSSVNQPCPTAIRSVGQVSGALRFRNGMTTGGAQVHDAIRFIANGGGGTERWSSGTIVITGYRCKVGTLYTQTFSGGTTWTPTLESDEYISDVFYQNLNLSTTAAITMQVGTGGTPVSSSVYRRHLFDPGSTDTGTGTSMFYTSSTGGNTGQYAFFSLFNMNDAQAPVCATGQNLQPDGTDTQIQEIRTFALTSVGTAYDQLTFAASAGTINSGTIFVQTYKPRRTLHLAQSLTSYGSRTIEITGLKKNNSSLLVCVSTDAARAAGDGAPWHQIGDSGGYDNDALWISSNETTTTLTGPTSGILRIGQQATKTGAGLFSYIVGLPQNTNTIMPYATDLTNSLSGDIHANGGSYETREVHDRIQIENSAQEWSAGTMYVRGYSL